MKEAITGKQDTNHSIDTKPKSYFYRLQATDFSVEKQLFNPGFKANV